MLQFNTNNIQINIEIYSIGQKEKEKKLTDLLLPQILMEFQQLRRTYMKYLFSLIIVVKVPL